MSLADAMEALAAAYGEQFTAERAALLTFELASFDVRVVAREVNEWIMREPWPPKVSDIIGRVLDRELGAPPPAAAFEQAADQRLSKHDRHPLVQKAKQRVGDMTDWNRDRDELWRRFRVAYPEVVAEAREQLLGAHTALQGGERPQLNERSE